MKLSPISLILLCCLSLLPDRLEAADPVLWTEPTMTSANYTIHGTFASALGDVDRDRMSSERVYMSEGSIDGFGVMSLFGPGIAVKVFVSGVDAQDAILLKGFSGFPGFFPGVSPTQSTVYTLTDPPRLQAPNVIYLPYNGKDNQARYVLTDYTISEGIPDWGSPSPGMTTTVSFTPTAPVSTITWNYKKQVRVSVSTSGEDMPLKTYDIKGDTKAGSAVVNLESTEGLAPGMLAFGNGILSGTTITAVSAETVILSAPAAFYFSRHFPGAGQRLTFAPIPAPASADPRECADSNAAVCAADAAAAKSGVRYYDVSDSSAVTLTALQSFTDSSGALRSLTQVMVEGGGSSAPVQLLLDPRKTLTTIGMKTPMTVEWRYDPTLMFKIGKPIDPVAAPSGKTVDFSKKPVVAILAADPALPGDTVDSAFVWAWDNSVPNSQRMKYFPIHPVNSFKVSWTCTDGTTFEETGKAAWHDLQKHIVGAPANLQPPDAVNTFNSVSYTSNGATATLAEFNAASPGYSVLRFITPAILPDLKPGAAFIVVESVEKPNNDQLAEIPWKIGSKITDASHNDPEQGKTGYLFNAGGVYDGSGPDKAYDRSTRKGAIIPVNASLPGDLNPLVVIWYEKGQGNIGWPVNPVRYKAVWPGAPAITIGSGIPVSQAGRPRAMVYNQPDKGQPGFNPNEEHALLTGDTLYALRDDLNAVNNPRLSDPYVLLKYYNADAGEWMMDVYQVRRPSSFTYYVEAGSPIVAPLPASFQIPSQSDIKKNLDGSEAGGAWHLRDHKGGHWAKAANWKTGDAVAEADKSRFVMQWYYYMRSDFYWPFTGSLAKKEGDPVPFLNDDADNIYRDGAHPIDVTYVTRWPDSVPHLPVGETLTAAKNGLPDLYNFKSAEVIFDENVYKGNGPLAKLYAPERCLYASAALPAGIKTETGTGGVLTFPEAPFAVQTRLFYDPVNKRLGFKGAWISAEGEEPWLLPNLMTAAERDVIIKKFKTVENSDLNWKDAVDKLYDLARNPNVVTYPTNTADRKNPFDATQQYDFTKWGIELGLETRDNQVVSVRSIIGEKNALTAGMAQGEGYVVIAENNLDALLDAPIQLHVIKVVKDPVFQGVVKAIKSKNVFDEKLTLHYTGDFGGEPENFIFEWYYQPVSGSMPALPQSGAAGIPWQKYITSDNTTGAGQTDITIQGASPLTLSDNWFAARYYYKNAWPDIAQPSDPPDAASPHDDAKNWSLWSGANLFEPMLAMGWVKRVVDGLNPLEARVTDFRNNATNTTVSMLSQFGSRYEGPIALNSDADNLNSLGLISAYETVLNQARQFSIDAVPPQDYGPTNDALLNISSRLATFYLALGNEAYADAVDPTIGFSTKSAEYGNMAPSVFSFQNQLDSLLDEELVLLRGRDDTATTTRNAPYYNRLIWNFTQGEGEVAYAQNYNITDQDGNGVINAADARIMYPQGHGDAWGHYLQAISYYYKLLGHPNFTWEPRVEYVLVAGNPIMVDYLDERKFASIAAARAKAGTDILDLTYRKLYTDDPAGQWQGYKDTYADRAWGVDEWARRAGQGAYFDWITANALLPDTIPAVALERKRYVQDANGAFKEEIIPGADIQQIDRSKVPELNSIASHFHAIQAKMNEVDNGVNPLGLVKGVVPFDIDPAAISAGQTHFEQIYDRASKALENAIAVYDYANGYTQRLRQNQDTLEQFKSNLADQERDYKNRLIEIFGYPYPEDIGAGKTYPDGYDGPDIWHYNYVDRTELTGDKSGSYTTFTATVTNADSTMNVMGLNFTSEGREVKFHIDPDNHWLVKPAEWTMKRKAPGKIQQTLSDLLVAQASYDKSLQKYAGMVGEIISAKNGLETRHDIVAGQIQLRAGNENNQIALDAAINTLNLTSIALRRKALLMEDGSAIAIEATPKVVGAASDVTAPIRGTLKGVNSASKSVLSMGADAADWVKFTLGQVKDRAKAGMELQIVTSEANYALNQQLSAMKKMFAAVDQQLLETYLLKETVEQASGRYQAALAEGLRLLDERMEKRAQAAAEVQEYRFQDLGFRVFRNDAIQKYRAQFDLAAKYVYLAATAYDYETNLLGSDSGSGRKFLSDIARQSSLGVFSNGKPMTGFPGLADVMARLSQNFAVYKTQLGFNNPQTETTPFSLRTGLFRIKPDASSDLAWQNVLKDHRVDDLWKIPEFKRFCRPFAPESAGPQPGIVIKFPTTITYGKNFFGWPLSGGDSAYSSSNFSTKVRSAGMWFQNYNSAGLSSTPRVYLVPAGADILRSPTGDGFATREWQVLDQVLPAPFTIGDTDMKNPDFIPANDSLSGEFAGIRRLADFRAYPYSGAFDPSQTTSDSRLVGRSVWNTQWMLIIPGSTLLFNKEAGLNSFINSVDDIKMFFQTYAYPGN